MKNQENIKSLALNTLQTEADALLQLKNFINDDFVETVRYIAGLKGRVIVTGIGKSAIIAQKMVATLNSTGTPSIFMHAADAIHGDLGIIQKEDAVICLSKSGESPEIKVLIPLLKSWEHKIVAITGNTQSYLARNSDFVLNTYVEKEACPNNLAPTTSSTAQLAMCDALAVSLLDYKGFSSDDFARYHPGGSLGKKLYLTVKAIFPNNAAPKIHPNEDIRAVISEISSNRLGAAAVIEDEKIIGIITDGDIRRMLLHQPDFQKLKAADIMSKHPKSVDESTMAADALSLMEQHNISQLLITANGKYVGMVHLHDLVKEGVS